LTLLQPANDIEREITRFKKNIDQSSFRKEQRLKQIPKKSDRRKEKERLARMRQKKKERISQQSWDSKNEQAPCWRFVYRDGTYEKVPVSRKKMSQI
jgi:hypothetical protein